MYRVTTVTCDPPTLHLLVQDSWRDGYRPHTHTHALTYLHLSSPRRLLNVPEVRALCTRFSAWIRLRYLQQHLSCVSPILTHMHSLPSRYGADRRYRFEDRWLRCNFHLVFGNCSKGRREDDRGLEPGCQEHHHLCEFVAFIAYLPPYSMTAERIVLRHGRGSLGTKLAGPDYELADRIGELP